MNQLQTFLDLCFSWPVVPATMLILFVCGYWLLVILGAFDIDVLDFDLDFDADADSILGFGWVGLRFLNLGEVPLMLWMSLFGLSWWTFTLLVDVGMDQNDWPTILWAMARNVGIAIVLTKLLTQPLRGRFEHNEPNPPHEMLGRTCIVTTSQVTPTFGHAEYKAEAAPLLLTVRTKTGVLHQGDIAVLVEYDPEQKFYYVSEAKPEGT